MKDGLLFFLGTQVSVLLVRGVLGLRKLVDELCERVRRLSSWRLLSWK